MKKKWLMGVLTAGLLLTTACSSGAKTTGEEAATDNPVKIGIIQLADHIALDRARQGFEETVKEKYPQAEIDYVNANGELGQVPIIINKFKENQSDLVYAIATPAAQGAKNILTDTPIVFSAVTDPISADLVASNEKPGANVTGVSDYYSAKAQLENFLKVFPETKTLGVLYSTNEANSTFQIEELKAVTNELGLGLEVKGVNNINDVATALGSLVPKIDAFVSIQDNLVSSSSGIIAETLIQAKVPSYAYEEGPVENGLLLSDGVDYFSLGQEAGKMALEILDGKNPGDIPVFYAQEASRVVNPKTAEALGFGPDTDWVKDANQPK